MVGQIPLTTPLVGSLRVLEYRLGAKRAELARLLDSRRLLYQSFAVPKRQHPYPGRKRLAEREPPGLRQIDNPVKQLKDIQRRILNRVLIEVKLPAYMFGAIASSTTPLHAAQHIVNQTSTLVRMDIKSYYPSVTAKHVYKVWNSFLGCPQPVAKLLTELTTYEWRLPQGAPTSPALANILLAGIFGPVCLAAEFADVRISTWIDDVIFSGANSRDLMELVRSTLAANGFKVSREKREIIGPSKSKIVTGVRLGHLRTRAPKQKVAELRAAIHRLAIGAVPPEDEERYRRNLAGRIAYISFLDQADGAKLVKLAEESGVRLK